MDVGESPFRGEPWNYIEKQFKKLFKTETEIPQMAPLRMGATYGGWKQSGLGQEECPQELLSYTQAKNINMRW